MNRSEPAIENIPPRQLAHAMLGLRTWIPRNFSTSANMNAVLPMGQRKVGAKGDTESYDGIHDPSSNRANCVSADIESVENTDLVVEKIIIASGVELTSHGTIVFNQSTPYAWFFPLPWRNREGWHQWRDQSEGKLLEDACHKIGLDDCLALLRSYQQQNFEFSRLPDEDISAFNVALPASIKEIITFSGLTCENLTGGSQSDDSVIIDWHGREVRVRCLPHPYSCLLESSSKKALWQGLIKLKYET